MYFYGRNHLTMAELTDFLPENYLSWGDNLEFLLRILLSAMFGIIIGLERSRRQKDAGIRTHCIIAVTSAAFMLLSKYAFFDTDVIAGARGSDSARLAAQVVSGISFLGAGVIFKDKNSSIKGLTTAAGMWATAAVGMSIGAGLYWVGIFETAVVVISQTVLHRFPVGNDAVSVQEVQIRITDRKDMYEIVCLFVKKHGGTIEQSEIQCNEGTVDLRLMVRCREPITHEDSIELIERYQDILMVSV